MLGTSTVPVGTVDKSQKSRDNIEGEYEYVVKL
jgi:hypothetical protein